MYTLAIPNLSCGHCVRAVTEAVQAADPAAQVQADLPTQQLQVRTTLPLATVVAQLTQAGYAPA